MFREVREKTNEISREVSVKLLHEARRSIFSLSGDNNYPQGVPLNYLFDEENKKIYFYSSGAGHKVAAIEESDKVCFTVIGDEVIKKEPWTPHVKSVLVFGRCQLIQDQDRSMALLKRFAMKYYPNESMVDEEITLTGKGARIFEITIEHLSGKEVQENQKRTEIIFISFYQ